jgi:hypothetical protein
VEDISSIFLCERSPMMQISGVPRFGFGISESSLKYVLEGKMNRLCLIAWAVLITAIGMFRLDRWGVRIDDIAKLRIEKLSARRASAPDHLLRADNDLARRSRFTLLSRTSCTPSSKLIARIANPTSDQPASLFKESRDGRRS